MPTELPSGTGFRRDLSCMIRVGETSYCIDPAGGVMDLLGRQWTLALIGILGNRPSSRFNEICNAITGAGSKAISDRLKRLRRLGLVERIVVPEGPLRVEYRLTPRGNSLRNALVPLLAWADEVHASPPPDVPPRDPVGAPTKGGTRVRRTLPGDFRG